MTENTKPPRPLVLGGITVKVVTGCGNMYIQLNWYRGKLFEVFATLGKGGGCAVCQTEGLTRGITLGVKYGVPVTEYIRQLRGIRCPTPMPFPREHAVLSCPDAIAKTLERYGGLTAEEVVKLVLVNGQDMSSNDPVLSAEEERVQAEAEMQKQKREREEQGLND